MTVNADQKAYWNAQTGEFWANAGELTERMHGEVTAALIAAADLFPGAEVLDIGCGTGQSSRAAARAAGPAGLVRAIDISTAMLDAARQVRPESGAAPIHYELDDAQVAEIEGGPYDRVISQFGVMFFDDAAAAFDNIRRACKIEAVMVLACWAGIDRNPWFSEPRQMAVDLTGPLPEGEAQGPGPMAFADTAMVTGLIEAGGWEKATVSAADIRIRYDGDAKAGAEVLMHLGPAARVLRYHEAGEEIRARFAERAAAWLRQYEVDGGLAVPATVWLYRAVNPGGG